MLDAQIREVWIRTVLLFGVTIGALASISSLNPFLRLCLIVAVACSAVVAWRGTRITGTRAAAYWVFVAVTAIAYFRFALDPVRPATGGQALFMGLTILAFAAFAYGAFLSPTSDDYRRHRLRFALLSPAMFVFLNLVLYFAGVTVVSAVDTSSSPAEMLGLMGISINRASLPLSPGLNGGGAVAAVALVACVYLSRVRKYAVWAALGATVSLATILLVDSRGPLVVVAIAILLVKIPFGKFAARGVPFALVLSPILVLLAVRQLAPFLSSTFSRGNGDFATATNREAIWQSTWDHLSHPHIQDIFGYGLYGQVESGISSNYAYLFPNEYLPQFHSVHNFALQTVLDTGWIGLGILMWFLIVALNSSRSTAESEQTPESVALVGSLVACVLVGASESLPGAAGIYLEITLIVLGGAAMRTAVAREVEPAFEPEPMLTSDHLARGVPARLAQ